MDKSKREYAEGLLRFDNAFEDGMYTDPNPKEPQPNYRIRDLDHYCKAKGVEPTDLTPEELRQFRSDL